MRGRSIKLYLVDGAATGLITAEIGQWTGKALYVPRPQLPKLKGRPEATRPGVYVLAGPDPERDDHTRVYIGEAENVFQRLRQHLDGKDFWTAACLFTSSDEQLTKAHVRYLESRLVEIARDAGRAVLDNGNNPPRPSLPEADVADMETYLEQVRVLLPVLGLTFAQSIPSRRKAEEHDWQFELGNVGTSARAREDEAGFVVLKGSTARAEGVDSWTFGVSKRDQLVRDGVLKPAGDPSYFEFSEDYAFGSPSMAAAVIMARNTNGRLAWRVRGSGQTYADWQDSQFDEVADSDGAAELMEEPA